MTRAMALSVGGMILLALIVGLVYHVNCTVLGDASLSPTSGEGLESTAISRDTSAANIRVLFSRDQIGGIAAVEKRGYRASEVTVILEAAARGEMRGEDAALQAASLIYVWRRFNEESYFAVDDSDRIAAWDGLYRSAATLKAKRQIWWLYARTIGYVLEHSEDYYTSLDLAALNEEYDRVRKAAERWRGLAKERWLQRKGAL